MFERLGLAAEPEPQDAPRSPGFFLFFLAIFFRLGRKYLIESK